MEFTKERTGRSDLLGVSASGLCAVHCILTPFLFAARPVMDGTIGQFVYDSGLWFVMDYIFWMFSLAAVWYSTRFTSHATIKWILWISLSVFTGGLLSEALELSYGKWFMYLGSISLIITHLQNHRYCQKCKDELSH